MILLTSVICVVLSLEFGVATPKGNRFKLSQLQNEGNNNKFNVERNIGEPMNAYNIPNNENELLYQGNQKNLFINNEDYEKMDTNSNPAAFRNVNKEQRSVFESKEYNQNTAERNINIFKEESSRPSYVASLPQVNRQQSFRPKDEDVNNEANVPRVVDILSEVNNPDNDPALIESKAPIKQENNPANQIVNKYKRPNSQSLENFNDKNKEDTTLSDVPVATPEYIKSLYNEDKHTKKNNVKPTFKNSPRNDVMKNNLPPNSQYVNKATFQNPSAEILYETGQAKPYEIDSEPTNNSRRGHKNAHNMLKDKQRLKNLYLSSKPTKHYMIVYPDGRVEQVDHIDKIQKVHPNYVMLNAKELLQHGKPNSKKGSILKPNPTTDTNTKPQINSLKYTQVAQIDKEPKTVQEQTLYVPNELPVATESSIILTTEITETNNIVASNEDQLKESGINKSQEKDKLNNNENTNSGILTTSDNSSNQVSSTYNTETQDMEDIVTTARSTMSTPTPDMVSLNRYTSDSLSKSNNTDNLNLSKQPEDSTTSSGNLINTKDDSVPAGENLIPKPKQESKEDDNAKNTTTIISDLNTIKENSNTTDRIDTFNVNNTKSTNSSSVDSSANRKESNSTTTFTNNEPVITTEDGTDSDGNTFHIETIVTKQTNEGSVQNLESKNATSSDSSTGVTNSNTTEIENSATEKTKNNMKPINFTFNPLTNNTSGLPENVQNNTDTAKIQTVSNVTNSEVNGNQTKNDDNNLNQDGAKSTDDVTEAPSTANPGVSNDEDSNTATDSPSDGGEVSSNDLYDSNSPQKGINEDDEDYKDNLDTESASNDVNIKESSFWFNANESFWKKLMSSNENNSFYFLFPRPQPNTKETKKIMYPNGTVVVETIETIDNGDGETNSTKTVVTCGNCTTCDQN